MSRTQTGRKVEKLREREEIQAVRNGQKKKIFAEGSSRRVKIQSCH